MIDTLDLNSNKSSKALSVSDLNRQVKRMLEVSYGQVWVSGEISGLSKPRSGHWYFTLKDEKAQIRCAMFKGYNQRLKFQPNEGDLIILRAKASLYEGRGEYQLIVESMEPAGLGQLQAAFDALKLKLSLEGLFDASNKKRIPEIPKTVAVITSATGAVIHDIISVTKRRYPSLDIIVVPVVVQGEHAAGELCTAVEQVNTNNIADVIIIGRGGGSLEDLWAFNDENLARVIFASRIPVISAVGHETDFTIADLVADYRAPTPSAAAEKITPDQFDLMQQLDQIQRRLDFLVTNKVQKANDKYLAIADRLKHPGETLKDKHTRLSDYEKRLALALENKLSLAKQVVELQFQRLLAQKPTYDINQYQQRVEQLYLQLVRNQTNIVEGKKHSLALCAQTLHTASPLATLGRGYAIIKSEKNKVLTSAKNVNAGTKGSATLKDGVIHFTVDQSIPDLEL